ncbi:hypothetical protein [Laspinema olomoucense]|uniref:Uncharacterized protein n=1 Tax=Laspinema olomoucense D3b TaxID=2953688 RepID=A0ABT2N5F9_9CYAN|nr:MULTISPECIES: hypothetical protein [unclassified Laspinema]MCT7977934.1 hypothetical protein [Laspinema sp. D3b]MCT7987002.1 hypothetical protein [Laspinema sp. D3a]
MLDRLTGDRVKFHILSCRFWGGWGDGEDGEDGVDREDGEDGVDGVDREDRVDGVDGVEVCSNHLLSFLPLIPEP